MTSRKALHKALLIAVTLVVAFAVLWPMYWILISSLKPQAKLFSSPVDYFPLTLTLESYQRLFTAMDIVSMSISTAVITAFSLAVTMVVCTMAGYAFARFNNKLVMLAFGFVIFSTMVPFIISVIPMYVFIRGLGLVDTYLGLVLLYTSHMVPFAVAVMTGFIKQIPVTIEEAAEVDGAGMATIIVRIISPLLKPAIATVAIINFIIAMNEFFIPPHIHDPEDRPAGDRDHQGADFGHYAPRGALGPDQRDGHAHHRPDRDIRGHLREAHPERLDGGQHQGVMGRRRIGLIVVAIAVAAAGAVAALAAFVSAAPWQTTVEFRIRDRVTGGPVWNATVTLQDRFLRAWYAGEGDALVFARLDPGEAVLEVSAPDYQSRKVPVTLRRGGNRIEEPIDMTGLRIPGLSRFMVSEDASGPELYATFWPLTSEGPAVVNHPALDLWIGARISAQGPAPPAAIPCSPARSSGAGTHPARRWRGTGRVFRSNRSTPAKPRRW